MAHFQNDDDESEKLRMENELIKLKLMLERGAQFPELPVTKAVDPVIENKFLNYIDTFEKSYEDAEQIKLFDFLGRPTFIAEKDVPDLQIKDELARITAIMDKNGIQLDTLCKVEDREIYRFITEELFLQEVDNVRIPGLMSCFIYEEFHQNHEYDIRNSCEDGMKSFLDKRQEFYSGCFTKEAESAPWFNDFRNAFSSFSLRYFEITDLHFDEQNARVQFNTDFTGFIEGSTENYQYIGLGSIELIYQYGFWYIQKITFPALASSK